MRVHQPWKTQDKERSRLPVCTAHALSRGQRKRQEEPHCPMRLGSITPCVVQSKRSTRIRRARSANSTHVGLGHRVSRVRVLRQYVLPAPGKKSSSHSELDCEGTLAGGISLNPGARVQELGCQTICSVDWWITCTVLVSSHDCFSRRPRLMFRNPSARFHNTPIPSPAL